MSGHEPHPTPVDYPVQHAFDRVMIKTGPLWAGLVGLITLIVFSMGLMRAFLLTMTPDREVVEPAYYNSADVPPSTAAPLNPQQVAQKLAYIAKQETLLNDYGWADEQHQVARIPVERAMTLVVEKYGKSK